MECGKLRPKRGRTGLWWWRVTNEWITTKIATIYTKNGPNRTVNKCGIDTPSEPNSKIPTVAPVITNLDPFIGQKLSQEGSKFVTHHSFTWHISHNIASADFIICM